MNRLKNHGETKAPRMVELACLFTLIALHLISCTTINPAYRGDSRPSSFEKNLNSLVNTMTYDEALMTWGEPASVFQGDEIFIATWGDKESGSAVIPIGKSWFAMPIESGWILKLSFNKQTRKMVSWKLERW
jgi:hypothetical protein